MRKIDGGILSFFQDISDKCQSIFGFNNFALARFSIGIVAVGVIILLLFPILFQKTTNNGMHYVVDFFINLFTLWILHSLYAFTKSLEKDKAGNTFSMTLVRIGGFYIRMYAMIFLIPSMGDLWTARVKYLQLMSVENHWNYLSNSVNFLGCIGMVCYWYFIACTPKPSRDSKIKKLKEKLVGWLQGNPALAPVGVPRKN